MTTLVIGYGNTLRGDDAAGITAAERIGGRYHAVDCVCAHQLGPEMAERISRYDAVIFIDAAIHRSTLHIHQIEADESVKSGITHAVSPGHLLALCGLLYGRAPHTAWLAEIPAYDLDFGQALSPETTRWVNACVESFGRLLKETADIVEEENRPESRQCETR